MFRITFLIDAAAEYGKLFDLFTRESSPVITVIECESIFNVMIANMRWSKNEKKDFIESMAMAMESKKTYLNAQPYIHVFHGGSAIVLRRAVLKEDDSKVKLIQI